jgi:hypothetical protein
MDKPAREDQARRKAEATRRRAEKFWRTVMWAVMPDEEIDSLPPFDPDDIPGHKG